jgi:hypothetical protein
MRKRLLVVLVVAGVAAVVKKELPAIKRELKMLRM